MAMFIFRQYGLRTNQLNPFSSIQTRQYSKFDLYGNSPIPANRQRFVPKAGTYPKGFLVGSAHIGIKPETKCQPDLILVVSEVPSCGAAVLSQNEFHAPSITVTRELLKKTKGRGLRSVVANSWCANLLTGDEGLEDSRAMSRAAGRCIPDEDGSDRAMVMHTGMGGQRYTTFISTCENGLLTETRLPIDKIINNIPKLSQTMGNSHNDWLQAARGMLTTDTFPKMASRSFTLPSSPNTTYSIAGITKGAGMIHPNMATTLGIICTDAPISPAALQQLLSTAADKSYNCISIEGDTSTNDMVSMLANGAAGGVQIDFDPSAPSQSADFISFQHTLISHMAELAKLVVRDGEGATKFVTIRVRGATSYPAGKHIASVIARSVLLKTAMYGEDTGSWSNVMTALGQSVMGTEFAGKGIIVPALTSVSFIPQDGSEELKFLDKGSKAKVDDKRAKMVMENGDIEVVVNLRDDGDGEETGEEAVYWTCDLTHEFVTINGDFRN